MNPKIFTLFLLALITSIISCRNNDDDNNNNNNNNNNLNGSFTANIDGVAWTANADRVLCVVAVFGSNPTIQINATRLSDSTYFSFLLPYFTATDTVITEPSSGNTDLRFNDPTTGGNIWIADNATLNISRSVQDGVETYTGTFNGNFKVALGSTYLIITGGNFTAKRLL